ncbi:hypothetical protein Syncc9902_0094 [Synechococcus sp. CC9902]|uniref:hypothetical protein n=1 Tax=Synechococcus sp. (strain CC9902) TaxID=316279 RepID=UPI00005D3CF7|nr:hypothetical protein [Synechococcus sp. CC9902]ABB25069.1 hypothetical protein Syncc9902_0094 [Synechococcus sp. CC9902]
MRTVGIVCHDAGGANVINSWLIRQLNAIYPVFFLSGPAKDIFFTDSYPSVDTIEELIASTDFILTGTGWQTKFEIEAISRCIQCDHYVISFLDHWIDYQSRFMINGRMVLPDELWVVDDYAFKLCQLNFSHDVKIKQIENYYLLDCTKNLIIVDSCPEQKNDIDLLFLLENLQSYLSSRSISNSMSEIDVLLCWISHLESSGYHISNILVRPHPSSPCFLLSKQDSDKLANYSVSVSKATSLVNDINSCDFIGGINTIALIIAAESNKPVYSILPSELNSLLPRDKLKMLYL